jgi:hypothetical protein
VVCHPPPPPTATKPLFRPFFSETPQVKLQELIPPQNLFSYLADHAIRPALADATFDSQVDGAESL